MKELEVTVFIYKEEPFDVHISAEGNKCGINELNVYKIFNGSEKPPKGVVVKFKYPDGQKKYVRN